VKLGIRRPVGLAEWVALVVCGLLAVAILFIGLAMVLAMGGTPNPFPVAEITHQKPYVDVVGRECRVVADVLRPIAGPWNSDKKRAPMLRMRSPDSVATSCVAGV
jgi:hypothetical protein